ncbi:MBOAT family O-acyltransferase [uncultured Porticoccus sp.]|uniref:MBOAT family O-acyltransferase n=1 Tax=uncultured Porticoccus sp. TaxID=1256050 RepID=UPI0030D73996|tara:strand:+ start:4221 stop:5783 length:1563 start_codon:yes stop_codon:yes gene_type:complete
MLFNSFEFLIFFLPATLALFFLSARYLGNEAAIGVLVLCSLGFYSWWNPVYLLLILFSMAFNFQVGKRLGRRSHKGLLTFGITLNLGLLAYYKYANFFVSNVSTLLDTHWSLSDILLPLAISFFTFQQIAYLVDSHRGITREYKFLHYALFVSFFPQLIAGPIVHHRDMLPQFMRTTRFCLDSNHFAIGLSIFAIGLFKKTVLADGVAPYANPVFNAVDNGQTVDFFTAWGGALAYSFQLYFDFSGYSDMAIGLARMFGIVLPLNFYSPYKAASITEFWRRWHITLSHFLRDYVYIALGGNRRGRTRRFTNLMTTMLLGGLWHGAGWNFIIWGGLHGLYLILHQIWQALLSKLSLKTSGSVYSALAWLVTMLCVVVGWVFFRATTFEGAIGLLQSMTGLHGFTLPQGIMARLGDAGIFLQSLGMQVALGGGQDFVLTWLWITVLLIIVLVMPNVQDMFNWVRCSLRDQHFDTTDSVWPMLSRVRKLQWKASMGWATAGAACLALGFLTLFQVSEFLYFQF